MSAQVVCCPALTILSVDHLTIHIPARPISTMTEPKAMFVMRSGERTIMSSEKCSRLVLILKKASNCTGLPIMETGVKCQPCPRLESMSGDSSLKGCWTWAL
jgi:hypothetical protein